MAFPRNIKTLRKRFKKTQEDVADALSIGRGRWAKYEEGRAEPPLELLRRIAEYFDVSLDKLLAEGEREKGVHPGMRNASDDEQGTSIDLIPGEATAGYMGGYGDPEYMERLEKLRIPFMPSGELRAFPVRGDSMLPVPDGSYVIGRYLDNAAQIRDGRTYVVVSRNEGISFKRVWNDLEKDGTLLLVPDNKLYRPYRIDGQDIMELWEYVGHLSFAAARGQS